MHRTDSKFYKEVKRDCKSDTSCNVIRMSVSRKFLDSLQLRLSESFAQLFCDFKHSGCGVASTFFCNLGFLYYLCAFAWDTFKCNSVRNFTKKQFIISKVRQCYLASD